MKKTAKKTVKTAKKQVKLATANNLKVLPPVPKEARETMIKAIAAGVSYDISTYQNWMSQLINPNPVMRSSKFTGLHLFAEMDGDAHVYNSMSTRKEALLSRPIKVSSAKDGDALEEEKAALVRWNLDYIKELVQRRREMQSHLDYGYSVSELIYERKATLELPPRIVNDKTVFPGTTLKGAFCIADIQTKPPSAFAFDRNGAMWMADVQKTPETAPPFSYAVVPANFRRLSEEENRHFVVMTHDPRFGSRYGWPLKASFFWDHLMKKAGKIYRMIFVEKYGMPFLKGTYPAGTDASGSGSTQEFEEKLKGLQKNSWIMVPEGFAVEFVDAIGKAGTLDVYQSLMDFCDGNVSEVCLGHRTAVSQTDAGSPFSNTESKTALRQDKLEMDAAELDAAFNDQLIPRLIDLNYEPNGLYPYVITDVEPAQDLDKMMFRYQAAYNMKVPLSISQFRDTFGFREPEDKDDQLLLEETKGEPGVTPNPDNMDNTTKEGFQNQDGSNVQDQQQEFATSVDERIKRFWQEQEANRKKKVIKTLERENGVVSKIIEEEV